MGDMRNEMRSADYAKSLRILRRKLSRVNIQETLETCWGKSLIKTMVLLQLCIIPTLPL